MPTRTGVDVVPHGVDPAVFRPPTSEEIAAARRALRLDGLDYVAFLGTLEPRKNVPALIRAWVQAVRDRERPPALVLAGGLGWDRRVAVEAARSPRTCGCCRPATSISTTCAGSSAARWSSRTRAWARASGCRCWRRWPAGRLC